MEYKSLMGPGTGGPGNMARDLTTEQMQILDATAAVCTYTKTRYEAKSHGGYDVYEDDKIRVELDTYVPNVNISISLNGEWQSVFSAGYGGSVGNFNRGAWVEYLLRVLLPRAEEVEAETIAQRESDMRQHEYERTAPIADSAVFN